MSKHPDEEIVDGIVEQWFSDLKLLVNWMTREDGGYIFQEPKPQWLQWQEFADPITRDTNLDRAAYLERAGVAEPGEQERYMQRMMELARKLGANGG